MDTLLCDQFVIVTLLIAAVVADEAYPKPAYPKAAYPAAYPKSYDYVSLHSSFPFDTINTAVYVLSL